MLPQSNVDVSLCLSSLIGIRSECSPTEKKIMWLEDLEGWDTERLSHIATGSHHKGASLGSWLIESAAREMMGDIELLMNNGYTFQNIVGDVCSSCKFLPTYSTNKGIIVKRSVVTNYGKIVITRITILANVTGEYQFYIDDGAETKYYTVELEAGVQLPYNMNYSTSEKEVTIGFVDNTVPLAVISCPTKSGCGCGSSTPANVPVTITGMDSGVSATTQYGFLVCAGVVCDYETLVCKMIKQAPRIFALTLLYKVGEKLTITNGQTLRNNRVASFNEPEQDEIIRQYGQLYWAKMKGTGGTKGIKNIVHDYMKNIAFDKCVKCESKVYSASAIG